MTLKSKFFGSPNEFERRIRSLGLKGRFDEEPNGVWHFRTTEDAGVHWSSTKGTIWCDGKIHARRVLEQRLEGAFRDELGDDGPSRTTPVNQAEGQFNWN